MFVFNMKLIESFEFLNIKLISQLLFTKFSDEVGIAIADFHCSRLVLKSASPLPTLLLLCLFLKNS